MNARVKYCWHSNDIMVRYCSSSVEEAVNQKYDGWLESATLSQRASIYSSGRGVGAPLAAVCSSACISYSALRCRRRTKDWSLFSVSKSSEYRDH